MDKPETWQCPIEDIAAIDKDLLKFYFDQAEKCLKSSIDLSDRITIRSYALLGVVIPVISLILGALAKSDFLGDPLSKNSHYILFVILVPLLVCFKILIWIVFPKEYTFLGSIPRNKVIASIFDNPEFKDINSYKLMLTFELEDYQIRIDYVDFQNGKRVKGIKYVFIVILATLSLGTISLIINYLVSGT